jgi:hypothetical protein
MNNLHWWCICSLFNLFKSSDQPPVSLLCVQELRRDNKYTHISTGMRKCKWQAALWDSSLKLYFTYLYHHPTPNRRNWFCISRFWLLCSSKILYCTKTELGMGLLLYDVYRRLTMSMIFVNGFWDWNTWNICMIRNQKKNNENIWTKTKLMKKYLIWNNIQCKISRSYH